MTIDEYKAKQDAHLEQYLRIYRVLVAAGLDGYAELDALTRTGHERDGARDALSYEDLMTVRAEQRAETEAILARGRAILRPDPVSQPPLDDMERR